MSPQRKFFFNLPFCPSTCIVYPVTLRWCYIFNRDKDKVFIMITTLLLSGPCDLFGFLTLRSIGRPVSGWSLFPLVSSSRLDSNFSLHRYELWPLWSWPWSPVLCGEHLSIFQALSLVSVGRVHVSISRSYNIWPHTLYFSLSGLLYLVWECRLFQISYSLKLPWFFLWNFLLKYAFLEFDISWYSFAVIMYL